MKFWQAMKALEEGKKVRCVHWDKYLHMYTAWCGSYLYEGDCDNFADIFYNSTESKWELYEEPERLLSFMEVVDGLKEGKKYRRKDWHSDIYINQRTPSKRVILENSSYHTLLIEDYEAKDWVEMPQVGGFDKDLLTNPFPKGLVDGYGNIDA